MLKIDCQNKTFLIDDSIYKNPKNKKIIRERPYDLNLSVLKSALDYTKHDKKKIMASILENKLDQSLKNEMAHKKNREELATSIVKDILLDDGIFNDGNLIKRGVLKHTKIENLLPINDDKRLQTKTIIDKLISGVKCVIRETNNRVKCLNHNAPKKITFATLASRRWDHKVWDLENNKFYYVFDEEKKFKNKKDSIKVDNFNVVDELPGSNNLIPGIYKETNSIATKKGSRPKLLKATPEQLEEIKIKNDQRKYEINLRNETEKKQIEGFWKDQKLIEGFLKSLN